MNKRFLYSLLFCFIAAEISCFAAPKQLPARANLDHGMNMTALALRHLTEFGGPVPRNVGKEKLCHLFLQPEQEARAYGGNFI